MTSASGFRVMKSSAIAVTIGRIDSDPTTCTAPEKDGEVCAPRPA